MLPPPERFWSKVNKNGPVSSYRPDLGKCWVWTASLRKGYGQIGYLKKCLAAHRVSYLMVHGSIPEGLTIDHLCRNTYCVNPCHLDPVSRGENVLRGNALSAQYSRRDGCKNGHFFDSKNTRFCKTKKTGKIYRECRACDREYKRKKYGSEPDRFWNRYK